MLPVRACFRGCRVCARGVQGLPSGWDRRWGAGRSSGIGYRRSLSRVSGDAGVVGERGGRVGACLTRSMVLFPRRVGVKRRVVEGLLWYRVVAAGVSSRVEAAHEICLLVFRAPRCLSRVCVGAEAQTVLRRFCFARLVETPTFCPWFHVCSVRVTVVHE